MTRDMQTDPSVEALELDNEAYDSEEDSDFQLDEGDVAGDDSGLSSSDDDEVDAYNNRPTKKRRLNDSKNQDLKKRKNGKADLMELDSGDEATISKAKSSRKTQRLADAKVEQGEEEDFDIDISDGEDGGGGGFVKTRAMRMKMQEERRPLAKIDGAIIDVDALWAWMNTPGTDSGLLQGQKPVATEHDGNSTEEQDKDHPAIEKPDVKPVSEDMIKIKRRYKFAGEIHTEEKLVPRDSAEARLYMAESTGEKSMDSADVSQEGQVIIKLRRPLRKISRFDPNPSGVIKKSWEKQAVSTTSNDADGLKGTKLNTVEKSRLDWAQYVDEAGIKDELNVHSKAKEGYLGRMDFLNRVDLNREEERRTIRLKGL